jgi:hypothetical protein
MIDSLSETSNLGAVIGGSIGGVVAIVAIALLLYFFVYKKLIKISTTVEPFVKEAEEPPTTAEAAV